MRLLLTNDDGIDAPGIAVLSEVAAEFGEVVVAAPDRQYSGCGHLATTAEPIQVEVAGKDRFRVHGSPADCVRVALTELTGEVDWVLSGVNQGGNLGVDIYMSGTVAATREAAFFGLPAIALSQYRQHRTPPDWQGVIAGRTRHTLTQLLQRKPVAGQYWNVNFPDPAGEPDEAALQASLELVECTPERLPLKVAFQKNDDGYQYAGVYQQRPRTAGSDVDVCFGGRTAVSLLGHALP